MKKAATLIATDAGITCEQPFPESKKNFDDDHISSCHADGSSSSRCKSNQGESCRGDASKNPFDKNGEKSSSVLNSPQLDSTNREENNDSNDAFNANNTTTLRFGVTEGNTTDNDNHADSQQNCTVPKPQSCKTQQKDETDGISEGGKVYFDGKDIKELNYRGVLKIDHAMNEKFENTAEEMNIPNISGTAFQEGGNVLTHESGERIHPEIEEQKEKILPNFDDTTTKIDRRNPVEIDGTVLVSDPVGDINTSTVASEVHGNNGKGCDDSNAVPSSNEMYDESPDPDSVHSKSAFLGSDSVRSKSALLGLSSKKGGYEEKSERDVSQNEKQSNYLVVDQNSDESYLGTDTDSEGFDDFIGRIRTNKNRSKKKRTLRVALPGCSANPVQSSESSVKSKQNNVVTAEECFSLSPTPVSLPQEIVSYEREVFDEDPLDFFVDTHEFQDPDCVAFYTESSKQRRHKALADLQREKDEDMRKIESFLEAKREARSEEFQSQLKKARSVMLSKQAKQRTQLAERHKKQVESDEKKVEEGIKWLTQRQRAELERRMQQHQKDAQRLGLTQERSATEWNKVSFELQSRHSHQYQQFEAKKADMKKKSEQELKAQSGILEAHHKKRQVEMEEFAKILTKKHHAAQETLRDKLLKLHQERYDSKRIDIEANDLLNNPNLQNEEGDSATKSLGTLAENEASHSHNAVLRQKRRKHIMNTAPIQLAVEIHNEGVIVMTRSSHHEDENLGNDDRILHTTGVVSDKTSGRKCGFIPWNGAKPLLYSIYCGEIPTGKYFDKIDSNAGLFDGGLVKCLVTDMRTSESTAKRERVEAFVTTKNIMSSRTSEEIERDYARSLSIFQDAEKEYNAAIIAEESVLKSHKEAIQQHDKAKATLEKFKAEAQRYFNQDGTPSPHVNPANQQKLLTAMYKFKGAFETTKTKENSLRKKLETAKHAAIEKKAELEKARSVSEAAELAVKKARLNSGTGHNKKTSKASASAIDEDDYVKHRIEHIISAILHAGEKRRSHLNQKKSYQGYCALWNETSLDIPDETKKSLWQKMQRRRITTMLRPSHAHMVNDIRKIANGPIKGTGNVENFFDVGDFSMGLTPALRAEELLLLSLHPECTFPQLPNIPTSSSLSQIWAEPGWHLNLSAPAKSSSAILFFDSEGDSLRLSTAECSSTGRQASSLAKPRHLSTLTHPLSLVSTTSAPAETSLNVIEVSKEVLEADPLSTSEENLLLGYKFVLTPPNAYNRKREVDVTRPSPTKRKRFSKLEKRDSETMGTTQEKIKRRKSQSSIKQKENHPTLACSSAESQAKSSLPTRQSVAAEQPNSQVFQNTAPASLSPTNTNMFNIQQQMTFDQHQAERYRVFLMQQQQQPQLMQHQQQPPPPQQQQQQQQQQQPVHEHCRRGHRRRLPRPAPLPPPPQSAIYPHRLRPKEARGRIRNGRGNGSGERPSPLGESRGDGSEETRGSLRCRGGEECDGFA